MKSIHFYICLIFGFSYSQDLIVTESNMGKITYELHTYFSPLGNYDVNVYVTDSISQYVELREEGVYKPEWNYEMKFTFLKYINNYNYSTGVIEENRVLKDSTRLYAKWNVSDLNWKITDEEKEINGYKVRKAVTDSYYLLDDPLDEHYRKAIAWFTTEIPIPVGPARYYGLPGLIVELGYEGDRRKYILKDIDFQADYKFIQLNKENEVDKFELIYNNHKNPKLIRQIQKENKKKKK